MLKLKGAVPPDEFVCRLPLFPPLQFTEFVVMLEILGALGGAIVTLEVTVQLLASVTVMV